MRLADEILQLRKNIPKALLITVALGSATGVLIIPTLLFPAPDLEMVATTVTPPLQIFYSAFNNSTAAAIVAVLAAGAVIGIHTWKFRMAWALSRDKGFPFHTYLSQIAPEPFGTPIWAHAWSCAWTAILGCLNLGSTHAFNSLVDSGILLQYLTYSASIGCLLWHGRANFQHGPFWFPRVGYAANITTIIWTVISIVMYSFPSLLPVEADKMNYVSCVIVGVLLFADGYWVLYGRKEFETPRPQDYEE